MFKEMMTLELFIAKAKRSKGDDKQIAELALKAIHGQKCCCPYDESHTCSTCASHSVQPVVGVIVRVSKQKNQICCVEWPVLNDEPGQLISGSFIRYQVRHCVGQRMFMGTIVDLGPQDFTEAEPSYATKP